MRAVRIWFTKLSRLQYISHLDMNRLMTRVVKRADIPIWYTEGFNQHPYITFLLPLSLFVQSECEIMDIKLTDDEIPLSEVADKLNAAMPDGMKVVKISDVWGKATEIEFSQYTIVIVPEKDCEDAFNKVSECLTGEELMITKKAKQGKKKVDKQVNLIDEIHSFYVSITDDGKINIDIILPSGTQNNVNPRLFTDAVIEKTGVEIKSVSIIRKRILNGKLEDFE